MRRDKCIKKFAAWCHVSDKMLWRKRNTVITVHSQFYASDGIVRRVCLKLADE